jgi:hypothetical protein
VNALIVDRIELAPNIGQRDLLALELLFLATLALGGLELRRQVEEVHNLLAGVVVECQ